MSDIQNNVVSNGPRLLLFFSSKACEIRRLTVRAGGSQRLELSAEEMNLSKDLVMTVFCREEGCSLMFLPEECSSSAVWIGEGKTPQRIKTPWKEEILVIFPQRKKELMTGQRLFLQADQVVCLGKSYRNQIFYECFSLIQPVHLELYRAREGYLIRRAGEGTYVNGKLAKQEQVIKTGDRLQVYGLEVLFLENFLVCIAHCGICRTAEGKFGKAMQGEKPMIGLPVNGRKDQNWAERRWQEEEPLHQGEREVIAPVLPARNPQNPLLLNLGPSATMMLPMLLMAFIGSRTMGGGSFYYMTAVMSICSCVLALFWGTTNQIYQKKQFRREERDRIKQYREYLQQTKGELAVCQQENKRIIEKKYPPFDYFMKKSDGTPVVAWNRYPLNKDFLYLRIGTGEIPFQIKLKLSDSSRRILPNKLLQEAKELLSDFEWLKEAPVGIDLYGNRILGILGEESFAGRYGVLLQLLLQLAACHSYTEVKTACFYQKENRRQKQLAECLRWMPHIWSPGRAARFLAGDEQEAAEIIPILTQELVKAGEKADSKAKIPWFIVVLLDESLIQGEPLYQYLTDPDILPHASVIFLGNSQAQLPKCCRSFIRKEKDRQELMLCGEEKIERQTVNLEIGRLPLGESYLRSISGFRIRESGTESRLPGQVGFLELYGCNSVRELVCRERWQRGRPMERLKAPIGIGDKGEHISLDIHEKFHGPHGLIAGTTGAGKSELLQTYLLSMAVSFSPQDVNFFLIDYKGGGTGNEINRLPHCAGVISNLSGKQIKRAMSAITSENKRRQRLLGSYGVNHIDRYMEMYRNGKADEPMPHLILVVDEFAELKKEEPDFMAEIISLAQVGRSLGVHLILATQKPAGTVDDRIWSNARFRLCLKVQDRQDSMDMLHRPEASALTAAGQCYLQIGNDEYFQLFQAAYCGAAYCPGGRDEKAFLVTGTGRRYGESSRNRASSNDLALDETQEASTELKVIVDYVNQMAEEMSYQNAKPLWMPELPEVLQLEEIAGGKKDDLILGLYDDPENQRQDILCYSPTKQGHLAVLGGPATGRTTLLQTVLWQLCTCREPEKIQFLGVDLSQGPLSCFETMPHCLGILKEQEEKDRFFYHLKRLIEQRKERLSGLNWQQYSRDGQPDLPLIFLVIDNFGSLGRCLKEQQENLLLRLAAEGISCGIYLLLAAAGPGELKGKLYEKIRCTLALELSDKFQYGEVLRQYVFSVLPKENVKGRGLCKVEGRILEFQTVLPFRTQNDSERLNKIRQWGERECSRRREQRNYLPDRLPVLPQKPTMELVLQSFAWKEKTQEIPLGYALETGELKALSMTAQVRLLIGGLEHTGRHNLLHCLEAGINRRGGKVVCFGSGHDTDCCLEGTVRLVTREALLAWQQEAEKETGRDNWSFLIEDMGSFVKLLYQEKNDKEFLSFWEREAAGQGNCSFMAGICHSEEEHQVTASCFFRQFTRSQQYIHLGGNSAGQRLLSFEDLDYASQSRWETPGIGFYREGRISRTQKILIPRYEGEKNDTGRC